MAEDWDSIQDTNAVVECKDDSSNAEKSLTASIKMMLFGDAGNDLVRAKRRLDIDMLPQYDSVYEIARSNGMTVAEWVADDPSQALQIMEHVCAEWQNVLTMAAIKGAITMRDDDGEEHDYQITRNQTKMIELRVREAQKQLDYVSELITTSYRDNEQRKDALERAMYQRALHGDTKLAVYLHDRVDGRPGETKTVDLDYDNAYNIYMIIHTLFDKQLEVLNSGNGTKLICCSRRAGKTHMLVAVLLIECLRKSRVKCMYVGETMELSEGLVDKAANDIIDACNLKDKRGKRFNWKKMDNGSEIMIRGLSNTKDPDQIRGNAAKVIVIDEFFHLKSELLEYLQREVLEPMQMDYADDYKFICAGTPPQVRGTYGEYVWKNWNCDHFSWTWRENPHPVSLDARKDYVDKILAEKGIDWTSSFARREYNGEWAYDDDLLLYPETHSYDKRTEVPNISPTRIFFGIDYGVGDNDTIWGCVWNDDEHRGYQFWETKFNRLDINDLHMSQLQYLCGEVKNAWQAALDYFPHLPMKEANKRILWDADDNDQHVTDYMNLNVKIAYKDEQENECELKLNIQNAHKTDKSVMYDRISDLLRTGDMLLIKGGKCEQEAASTIVKRGPNGEVYKEVDLKAYHPDLLPAMRYALWNALGI